MQGIVGVVMILSEEGHHWEGLSKGVSSYRYVGAINMTTCYTSYLLHMNSTSFHH